MSYILKALEYVDNTLKPILPPKSVLHGNVRVDQGHKKTKTKENPKPEVFQGPEELQGSEKLQGNITK